MEKQRQIVLDEQSVRKIQKMKSLSVAFNETEFLLVINNEKQAEQEGYLVSIPTEVMHEVVCGLFKSGLEYQKYFNKDIGFIEQEV